MTDFTPILNIRKLDPLKPSMEIGVIPKNGLIVLHSASSVDLLDEEIQYFFEIRVDSGGDLFIRGIDGNVIPYLGVRDGQWLVGEGNLIYSSIVINGQLYTTTCGGIVVYGGQ